MNLLSVVSLQMTHMGNTSTYMLEDISLWNILEIYLSCVHNESTYLHKQIYLLRLLVNIQFYFVAQNY